MSHSMGYKFYRPSIHWYIVWNELFMRWYISLDNQ